MGLLSQKEQRLQGAQAGKSELAEQRDPWEGTAQREARSPQGAQRTGVGSKAVEGQTPGPTFRVSTYASLMSVSPRRRGMRSTKGLHGGLLATSAPAGRPLQCRSESAGDAVAPAHGRLLLHDLPEKGDMLLQARHPRERGPQLIH